MRRRSSIHRGVLRGATRRSSSRVPRSSSPELRSRLESRDQVMRDLDSNSRGLNFQTSILRRMGGCGRLKISNSRFRFIHYFGLVQQPPHGQKFQDLSSSWIDVPMFFKTSLLKENVALGIWISQCAVSYHVRLSPKLRSRSWIERSSDPRPWF